MKKTKQYNVYKDGQLLMWFPSKWDIKGLEEAGFAVVEALCPR